MIIVVCHSRYRSGAASGENRVADDEIALLRRGGHEVISYMPSPQVSGMVDLLRAGLGAVWNSRAVQRLEALLQKYQPDVVHFHNLFPSLSPASLRTHRSQRPALLMTLHNYRLLCLPATFLRDGAICQDCLGTSPWRGVLYRCYQGSTVASGALAFSITTHRAIGSFDRVDRYLAISEFIKLKHIEGGLPEDKIQVKRHFAWPSERRKNPGDYFLFLGRLSEEKGVTTLLRAWPRNGTRLLIAGGGPEEAQLRAMASESVEFVGSVPPERAQKLIMGARSLIVPSIWYEGAGRVVMEAYASGVPVIASDIGGLSEVVSLRHAIERLLVDRESERLGEGAFRMWNEHYRPERALVELEEVYKSALGARDSLTHR
jgi:glycosyltransferase involved in cell wall biosynthesis